MVLLRLVLGISLTVTFVPAKSWIINCLKIANVVRW